MKTLLAIVILAASMLASAQTSTPPPITLTLVAPIATPTQLGCGTVTSPTVVLCAYRLFRMTGTCPATLPTWPTAPTGTPPVWTVPTGWTQVDVTGTSQLTATDTSTALLDQLCLCRNGDFPSGGHDAKPAKQLREYQNSGTAAANNPWPPYRANATVKERKWPHKIRGHLSKCRMVAEAF